MSKMDSLYAISSSFEDTKSELVLLEKRLNWFSEEHNDLDEFMTDVVYMTDRMRDLSDRFDEIFNELKDQ